MRAAVAGLLLACLAGTARAGDAACAGIEARLAEPFDRAWSAEEPGAALEEAAERALDPACAASEPAWYYALRLVELGALPVARLDGGRRADLRAAAEEGSRLHPRSARIAVVRARAIGDEASARAALEIDPRSLPARVALGAALLHDGKPTEAAALLGPAAQDGGVPGAWTLLARARLALGDPAAAIAAARREAGFDRSKLIEPATPAWRDRVLADAWEAEARAQLATGHADAAARLLVSAADRGSEPALAALADPRLRAPLRRLARARDLTPSQRALLRPGRPRRP